MGICASRAVLYSNDKVKAIAALPAKNELLVQVVRGFNAPIQGLVGGLNQLLQKLVFVFDAIRSAKENES